MPIRELRRQEKAFIGDALARLLVADILLGRKNYSISESLSLITNSNMAKCIKELRWIEAQETLEMPRHAAKKLGTVYEIKLYKVYKHKGIEGARDFIMKTLLKDYNLKEADE